MAAKRRAWAIAAALALLCVAGFLVYAVRAPSYQRAKEVADDLGDKPYIYDARSDD